MEWIVSLIIGVALFWYWISRPKSLDFWKLAAKYPDAAYDYFISQDCWKVFDNGLPDNYKDIVTNKEWTVPFRLWVPKLGNRMITIFCKYNYMEDSQREFISKYRG